MTTNTKIAVVTGGAGFIGSHLVEELLARGYRVRVIDTLVAGKREHVPPAAEFFNVDVRDRVALTPIFAGAHTVFHLAALPRVQYTIEHPLESHEVNVTGTQTILQIAKETGASRTVFASSAAIYGDSQDLPLQENAAAAPLSPYALHKYISEEYLKLFSRLYGLSSVSLRFFNVYGPRLDPEGPYALVVGRFLKQRRQGEPLTVTGDGEQTRDFIHVQDVVRSLVLAGETFNVGAGEVINIGSGKSASVNRIAELVGGPIEYVAPRVEPRDARADNRRAKQLLGWEPTISLEDGITELKKELGL
ncbi:NAD-dependent epimerase/dehydratase family protein [Patescibacteria group bacterium]|nr:NAD-dependent epimerase/dehydratase family protein [Patescibacteria group bacterium]